MILARHEAIRRLYPQTVSIHNGKAYDDGGKQINLDEAKIAAEVTRLKAEYERTQYRRDRAREYPPVGDQLDAIWKALNQLRMQGTDLPADTDHVLGEILAVKKRYPKP